MSELGGAGHASELDQDVQDFLIKKATEWRDESLKLKIMRLTPSAMARDINRTLTMAKDEVCTNKTYV